MAGSLAENSDELDLTDVGEKIRGHLPTWLAVLTGGAFLGGFLIFLSGLFKSNTLGNQRAAHVLGGHQSSYGGAASSIIVGVLLMFSAALVLVTKTSTFGEDVGSVNIQGIKQLDK
jgi:hypothetical protein